MAKWVYRGVNMSITAVQVDAGSRSHSLRKCLHASAAGKGGKARVNPVLKFWRWMINSAVSDAKKTRNGLPTDAAILARWWLEEHKPSQSERGEWERSLACCCQWLEVDLDAERKRLLAEIDESLSEAYRMHVRVSVYTRRAAVLACAGVTVTLARQHVLPLVSDADYEHIADIDHGDPAGWTKKLRVLQAA